jgi:hypothetical protein
MRNGHVPNVVVIDREEMTPHYLPDGVRQKFAAAEAKRADRTFWLWTAIVAALISGLGIIAWAISKI